MEDPTSPSKGADMTAIEEAINARLNEEALQRHFNETFKGLPVTRFQVPVTPPSVKQDPAIREPFGILDGFALLFLFLFGLLLASVITIDGMGTALYIGGMGTPALLWGTNKTFRKILALRKTASAPPPKVKMVPGWLRQDGTDAVIDLKGRGRVRLADLDDLGIPYSTLVESILSGMEASPELGAGIEDELLRAESVIEVNRGKLTAARALAARKARG